MRRPLPLCACLIALLTGAWGGLAYPLFTPAAPTLSEDPAAKVAVSTAWSFYDAIDHLLRTADDTALRAVVAPGFVDHVDAPSASPGRDALVAYLASLRETHPTLRLVPEDVVAQGDRAVARLAATGAAGEILGVPFAGKEPWPRVDVIRVEDGLIVERWGDPAGYAPAAPIFAETLKIAHRGDLIPTLRRDTVAPGARDASSNWRGPAIIAVESGALEVISPGDSSASRAPELELAVRPDGQTASLAAGDVYSVGDGVAVAVANRTENPAIVLVLALSRPMVSYVPSRTGAVGGGEASVPMGVASRQLAGSSALVASTGQLSVALARVTLAPGVRLAPHPVAGLEIVVVDAGTGAATVATTSGYAWLQDPRGRSISAEGSAELPHGFSLTTKKDAITAYANETDEATTLLLLTVTPV